MKTCFLLGPAGSGKTYLCLEEIRAALAREPDPEKGGPLILIAPKQATFQLERQLLAASGLAGFSRLQILSFDRLAQYVFTRLGEAAPPLLSGEGRLMVLRALLHHHAGELKLFSASARRYGFAQELGTLLAELQQQQFTPAKLRSLAANEKLRRELRDKLLDLALILEHYQQWLRQHDLQDANCLLDAAAERLQREPSPTPRHPLRIAGLWLDGFAEMTPQELTLLAALSPFCEKATLAFCLETEPTQTESWLSIWSAIGKTYQQCRQRIAAIPGNEIVVETLRRTPGESRFVPDSDLALLEETWSLPISHDPERQPNRLGLIACPTPEAEAIHAAREILQFVRAGNRFRDCAVLVRSLEGYHKPLARILAQYEIPYFLDQRENVAHHPLAELTRNALRTVAFDWRHDDWFAALKCGFAPVPEAAIDDLENQALEFGWRGKQWREPLAEERFEATRLAVLPPFEAFYQAARQCDFAPSGQQLAEGIRELWQALEVEAVLDRWNQEQAALPAEQRPTLSPHDTVWDQMNSWLDNLALAFPRESLPLKDWLPVLEAGLGNLTIGVIPPALDEVLVGAIDRARNPDLKFALILGVNEAIFPAAPAAPAILTNADRAELEAQNMALAYQALDQIARERYLGYIACTRAHECLLLSFSRQGANGKTLNPSPFIAHIQRLFPKLKVQEFNPDPAALAPIHPGELIPQLVSAPAASWQPHPRLQALQKILTGLQEPAAQENLSPEQAGRLYGQTLGTSVSRLEEFAACPFKFFMRSGLRANERKQFELDARERGNFQHDVLKEFHDGLKRNGQRWRDITPQTARDQIGVIADRLMGQHRDGLLQSSAATAFAGQTLKSALQDFVELIVTWMHSQYDFDPVAAEIGFGGKEDTLPAWKVALTNGRQLALQGRIDRVDIFHLPASDQGLVVVTDYKSGNKKLDPLLVENGLQLQLLAYLGALRSWQQPPPEFNARRLEPAGAFYVSLRGKFESGKTRAEILGDPEARKHAYSHSGRFNASWLRKFDRRNVDQGDQFKYKLNKKDGLPSKTSEALPAAEFAALLDLVEGQLIRLGEAIFAGTAAVDPYRRGSQTPCQQCDYRAACRIDEWSHEFRTLQSAEAAA